MNSPTGRAIPGGQTGADRGGLDAAIAAGVPHGGWCPKGRKAEDGAIPAVYQLVETSSADHAVRTERNVVDSHCTVVFSFGRPTGGSEKTVALAGKHRRPCLWVDLTALDDQAAALAVLRWLSPGGLMMADMPVPPPNPVLNVAGSRESKASGIQERVRRVVAMVLNPPFYVPQAE